VRRRRFGDRLLSLCGIALLGSLALVPTATLAGTDHHVTAAATDPNALHNGDDAGAGDDLHIAHGQHEERSASSQGSSDKAAQSPAAPPAPGAERAAVGNGARSGSSLPVGAGTPPTASPASPPGQPSAATPVEPATIQSTVLVRGVSLPGNAVPVGHPPTLPVGSRTPATRPGAPATTPPRNPVLGPVPVLVPSLGETITHTESSLPWAWFIAFALLDLLLLGLVLVRRRGAGSGRRS
jgi:hypothetical protein